MPIRPIGAVIDSAMLTHETYLTAEAASGTATLTAKSISGFAINQILLIGDLGDENAEIIKTHTATAPTGSTITLASNLTKTHSPFTKVTVMLYDQIEFSHADTATGSKSLLDTIAIQAEAAETRYDDSANTSGYYFTRYKNTVTTTYSDYSDPIPYGGFEQNTVSFVINYALKRNKQTGFTEFVDFQFCIDEINACLNYINGKLRRWTKLFKTDEKIGHTERGINRIALPTDIWENRGTKSLSEVRIGKDIVLQYKNWSSLEIKMEGVANTQVRTEAAAGAITLEIDNSYDFDDSGSVNIYVSGTLCSITYTGVTRSDTAGVLTGIPASGTGSITVTIPVDTEVWQGESEGVPEYFSVDGDGNLVFYPLADATNDHKNICADYATGPTKVDSDADTLDAFRYDAVKYWLAWTIRMQIDNNGKRELTDGDYLQFSQILSDYIRNEVPAHRKKRGPKINSIKY